ncbi:MAG: outer membrane protein assembly factor BamA [Endomicrobium sp.]|jgi:outer membrane protein insertion porin family|nr:outer membrane protein assembly factor BamA [Endomicrobium sp.]
MKCRIAVISFILFFASFVYATDRISFIIVDGLHSVKLKTVLSAINVKKGEVYSAEVARENVRSISALDYFENVEVSFDDQKGILAFTVSEKPYIHRIVFKGNSSFSTGKLKSTSTLKEKEYYDLLKLEETKSKILDLYRDKGYADCQIEAYPTIDADTNKITVTFVITENNKIVIGGVDIEGVFSFKNKKILKLMKTRPKKIFKDGIFQADLMAIQTFYKDNGFMDYQLLSSSITYNDNKTAMFLKINIDEGNKYEIGDVSYSGTFAVEDKDIQKTIKLKRKQIYNQDKVLEIVRDIYSLYSDRGYLNAKIEPEFNKSNGTANIVDVNFSIQENTIVYVGNIYIDGLVSTKDKVIRREVLLSPGDVFSLQKVRRSVEKIYNLGFIESVETQPMPTGAQDVLDLSLSITEGKPGMITAGVGYSSVDQLIGSLQLQHLNLFGLGQRLNLLGEFGSRRRNYEIDWTEPRILDQNIALTLSIFDTNRKKDYATTIEAYEEWRRGASAKIAPKLSDYVALMFGYTFEDIKLRNIKDDVKKKIEYTGDLSKGKTSSIFTQIIYDSRDYVFDPSKGNRQLLNFQVANDELGGEINFIRGIAKSTWFFPTFWKFVLSANFEFGAVTLYGNNPAYKDVPIYERFYLGGPSDIRGYKPRVQIGPNDGGKVKGVFNLEYKFPIITEKGRSILTGAFFYDIGASWKDFNTINLDLGTGERNLRSGVGFGIRIATPVFPVRLDWGYGLNHREHEPLQEFYFTMGNAF